MASATDPRQTETTTPQDTTRQQAGGNGGTEAGQQVQSREGKQESGQTDERSRVLARSRGRRDLSTAGGNPFELMAQLSREMDRMMSAAFGGSPFFGSNFRSLFQRGRDDEWNTPTLWTPRVDVEQRGDSIVVRADLPGVRKEDIQLEVTDEGLTISGERREEHEEGGEGQGYRAIERRYGSFYRTIPLGQKVKTEQLKAKMRDGVLQITIPLDESARPRQIEIED
jgi:HSP20 family protein